MYFVYILECSDKSLYTGIAKDVEARLALHRRGKGAKYTLSHKPKRIVYREKKRDRSMALKREIEIKKLTRVQKRELIRSR